VGRVYQQTVIDTYAKVAFAKLYDRKTPITAAEILNDRVVPFYDEHGIRLSRMLTDRGTEFCGTQSHEYELYLAVEDIDHCRTKTKSPQTNGICERFHRTVLDEFYRIAFRKKIYHSIDELQADLDTWLVDYNCRRPNQGRWCFGKTRMQTFLDALPLAKENSWRHDHRRQLYRFKPPTPSCPIKSQLIHMTLRGPATATSPSRASSIFSRTNIITSFSASKPLFATVRDVIWLRYLLPGLRDATANQWFAPAQFHRALARA
jgi:hypothetical protein